MPSSILHDQIPHSILFPNQSLFYLPPHFFGCVCFAHILYPRQDKLSAKAIKCVFLSYAQLQRGYHCYSLDTHRYFISVESHFLRTLLCSLPPPLQVLMSYLYPFFFPFRIPHLYLHLYLDHCKFISNTHVLTPGLRLTHLLWCLPPRCRSCHLPIVFTFPFGKVLVPLVTLILFIVF